MKRALSAIAFLVALFTAGLAQAQDYWVQLKATPTLAASEEAARGFAAMLPDVNGFRLGASGWYAVALGPYTAEDATQKLIELRALGAIPTDSYISDSAPYGQRFWPVGADTAAAPATESAEAPAGEAIETDVLPEPGDEVAAPAEQAPAEETPAEPEPAPETPAAVETAAPAPEPAAPAAPVIVEETRDEALAGERALDADARKALQVALQWEGFYNSVIDGDFGPGTRGAMAAWQADKGYDETGILTTRQRDELTRSYNDILASMSLALVTDDRAGIEITIPAAMVAFSRYEAPFAHYEGGEGVRVVLISQRGDKATLWGLYDILQTLSVVPPDGPRNRGDNEFTIEGANDRIVSYTYATLTGGAVKGWMLVWPQGPEVIDAETGEARRDQDRRLPLVLDAMRQSFTPLDGAVLADNEGLDTATQSIDLVSGLEIRRPEKSRSGFFVTDAGAVLTTTEAVDACARITLDEAYEATVTARDDRLGIALLQPTAPLAPLAVAQFLAYEPRLQSELSVAGYSYGGKLSSPTLTYGTLADVQGLNGETDIARLAIRAQDGDTGGPIVDQGGAVAGMLLATPADNGQVLPTDVGFYAKTDTLVNFLAANGIEAVGTAASGAMTPFELSDHAADLTVLVSCWN